MSMWVLSADDPEKYRSSSHYRCPKCKHLHRIDGDDGLHPEGEHELSCGECGWPFQISTYIHFTFTSPELIREE